MRSVFRFPCRSSAVSRYCWTQDQVWIIVEKVIRKIVTRIIISYIYNFPLATNLYWLFKFPVWLICNISSSEHFSVLLGSPEGELLKTCQTSSCFQSHFEQSKKKLAQSCRSSKRHFCYLFNRDGASVKVDTESLLVSGYFDMLSLSIIPSVFSGVSSM